MDAPFTRRGFLAAALGAAASPALLAACGGATGNGSAAGSGGGTTSGDLKLVQFFRSDSLVAGLPQRLPFGLGDTGGVLQSGGPASATFRVFDVDGKTEVQPAVTVERHTKDLSRPYWPLTVNLPAGTYRARMEYGSKKLEPAAFALVAAGGVPLLQAGSKLPAIDTPTTTDARGVNPICTRQPACPLHGTSLKAAIGGAKPIAFLVATPAYCQTAICGPVLDVLSAKQSADITMIHAEVYVDPTAETKKPTQAVDKTGLAFEPCLFLARADGTIVERLDVIFDSVEVAAALDRLRKA